MDLLKEISDMMNKLEKKLGKYAIPNLMKYLIIGYVIGYFLMLISSTSGINFIQYMTLEPYFIIHKFQIWRIFTWVMIPETTNVLFFAIMLLLYYQLGNALENAWGVFRFNAYIFGGMLFTLIGAFVLYFVYGAVTGSPFHQVGGYFSMQYINLSIFLAFAVCFPDMQVLLYFFIPVKMKWMAILYAVMIVFGLFSAGWSGRVAIICSLLNFAIFYLSTRNYRRMDPRDIHRRNEFKRKVKEGQSHARPQSAGRSNGPISRHKCAICGRTELTNPELEFRFCSKCNGNYEYCSDHLFTHKHVQ